MALLIQKFGGTSLGSLERIQAVAKKIAVSKREGNDVVVVVSAMGGETNRLIQMAESLSASVVPREQDALLASGEQVSAALLSIALQKLNISARSYTALQLRLNTNGLHRQSTISKLDSEYLQKNLKEGVVSVVTGFQGVNQKNDITTLGRGGSDITAVALAAVLKADECQIYTDVEGVYTSDPRVVKKAQFLNDIDMKEMLELSALGAGVLHPRAVQLANRYQIPVRVLSSFSSGKGTLVNYGKGKLVEKPSVCGIAFKNNYISLMIKSLLEDQAELISRIMTDLVEHDARVDHIAQYSEADAVYARINLIFQADNNQVIHRLLEGYKRELSFDTLEEQAQLAKLSVVGHGIGESSEISAQLFSLLQKESVLIYSVMHSSNAVSILVDAEKVEHSARKAHDFFIK